MAKKTYITEEEQEKCRKVVDTFAEFEDTDVVVVDVGRYGFVKLQYYTPPTGFENGFTFMDSRKMFEDLWEEWLHTQIIVLAREMGAGDIDYDIEASSKGMMVSMSMPKCGGWHFQQGFQKYGDGIPLCYNQRCYILQFILYGQDVCTII